MTTYSGAHGVLEIFLIIIKNKKLKNEWVPVVSRIVEIKIS